MLWSKLNLLANMNQYWQFSDCDPIIISCCLQLRQDLIHLVTKLILEDGPLAGCVTVAHLSICMANSFALTVACMGKDQLDGSHENNHVSTRRVSPQFTFLFSPFYKYGACSSAQDGGYLDVGTFNKQVDPTNGLNLVVYRQHAHENYQFRFFLIEIL